MRFEDYIIKDNIITIDWGKVKRPTESLKESMSQDILFLTDWRIQKQLGTPIFEVFNTKINVDVFDDNENIFNAGFKVNNIKYIFMSRNTGNDTWSILFMQSSGDTFDLDPFTNKKGKSNTGVVISGVFRCIQILIQNRNVKYIIFGTEDDDLKEFYTLMIPYIEKRLPLKLHKKDITHDKAVFQYRITEEL